MSFRVILVSSSSKLDLKLNQLVIRNQSINRLVISEISILILESTAISITAALLCELIKNKVKVVFCDEKRNPISELVPYYGSHNCSLRLKKQISWDVNRKEILWTAIVKEKIQKQLDFLEELGFEEYKKLDAYIDSIEHNDVTNREGHAAKVYFNALFGKKFKREDDNPINSALNYGYSILLSAFNREIVSSGYVTQLGLFHDNMYNQFNLSCDLMEPFRILVDRIVLSMSLDTFGSHEKEILIQLLNREVYIDNTNQYLLNAIKIYIKSIFDYLNDEPDSYIKWYRDEL